MFARWELSRRWPGLADGRSGLRGSCAEEALASGSAVRWLTAQVTHTGGMGDDPADGAEAGEVFDHELTRVLHEHAQVLEEQSRALQAAGAASISVPGVILHARLRIPRGWRKGLLEVTAEDPASGEVRGSSSSQLGRAGRNHGSLSLIDEITVQLAFEVVYGPSAQVRGGMG